MNKKIVVAGSSNTDMILQMKRIPKPGETLLGGRFSTAAGGKGANQAVAAARAGGDVSFIARVGNDMFGKQAVEGFCRDGIDTRYVFTDPKEPSGVALIFVADNGENSIGVASGANGQLSIDDIDRCREVILSADILLMQLEIPLETVRAAVKLAAGKGIRVILNPAPAQPLSDDILQAISILTPNESETELLTGIEVTDESTAELAAKSLHQKGVEIVIITMGASGAYVYSNEFTGLVSSFPVKPVDTTAAGDVFNGALAVALSTQMKLKEAVRFANAAAALSVTQLGAQTSAPELNAIMKLLNKEMKT